jgi:uncharacterized membrane protein
MRMEQQQAQSAAIHLQVKAQTEAGLAKLKADLDARLQLLDAHIRASTARQRSSSIRGARKARDGHHYVADPQRSSKFLKVFYHG